jgi:CheY-like chemotaxis protein
MDYPSSPDRDPKRLLLVEDDVDQAHLVKYLLEADGTLTVTLAQDGLRAMQLLEESDWDLLITDINLPGADGIEVVEASRRLRPELPILATTGYTGPEYGARARERGADAVLIKPLDRDDLLHHVEILLAGRTGSREASPTVSADPPGGGPPAEDPPESEKSVLVLSARPGDAEVGCGGAILAHIQRGDRVVLLHLSGSPSRTEMGATLGRDPASAIASEKDHGSESDLASDRDREAIKAAGRRLGARTFITSLEDSGEEAQAGLVRLVAGAIGELRPDVLYLPTAHHPLVRHQTVHRVANEAATDVPTILAYDPGDASPSFAPELFVTLEETRMDEKLRAALGYERWGIDRLQPGAIRASAAFWARYADSSLAEGLEVIRATSDSLPFNSSLRHPDRDVEESE